MTATGNEAVRLSQLKDYTANQSAGGGSGYTYENATLSTSASNFGNWVLKGLISGSAFSDPIIAICYNDSELVLECVSTANISKRWRLTVTNNAGTVHCLGVTNSSEEAYPMYIGVPYSAYGEGLDVTGTDVVKINKSGNTLTVESTFSQNGYRLVASTHLRFYVS